jgi:MFS family permease
MRWFLFTMVLANIASHMHMNLMPLYLRELGASVGQVGLAFTVAAVVPLALQILGGWISDSLGRLRTIALGSVGGVLSYIALVLAPSWEWVLLGLGLGSVARSMVGPSFGAFIAEQSDEANRGKAFGVSEGIFMLVAVIGPPLGGILAERFGFKLMFLAAGLLYGLAAVLRFWMANQVRRTSEGSPRALSLQSLRASLGTMFGLALAGGLVTWILVTDGVRDVAGTLSGDLLPLFLKEEGGVSVEGVGWLTSIFGVAMMAVTLPSGWLADRRGERVSIAAGFVVQAVALFVMLSVHGFMGFGLAWALFGVGVGLMNPAYNSLVSKVIPERLRGTAFGLLQTSVGLFSLPAPYVGAQLWERLTPRTPFALTGLGLLAAAVPAWLKFKPKEGTTFSQERAEKT